MSARRPGVLTRLVLVLSALLLACAPQTAAGSSTPHGAGGLELAARSAAEQCRRPPVETARSRPWAQERLAPERAWELSRGEGVTVAVIDSGVDATTPQLAGGVLDGVDVLSDGTSTADTDCLGHGTFVAGIIAARPAPDTGFTGIAPAAAILPVRDTHSAQDGSVESMARGIRAATRAGAQVINISASTNYDDAELRAAVEHALSRDVVVVAAAANGAQQGNPVPYPAAYPGVLAVGAINADSQRADFSQTGEFLDLVAPGVDVVSVGPGGPGHWQDSGTSFATPFVSGTAALVRSHHPELTAAQVRHRVKVTASRTGTDVPNAATGWGVVDPYSAVTSVLPSGSTTTSDTGSGRVEHPDVPRDDPAPLRVVLISTVGTTLLISLAALGARLGPGGWRRRWRRPRVVHVVDSQGRTRSHTSAP
ncbi:MULTISPECIES: type VII secretion-associated serine protease mycosin [unclassified Actinopolyspora]|uniref:type VII secretion-associated serine protease mycosin n=1 Tax=unclassified Actinopolyspora TaxID=2639451 RepID=UPI001A991318|nr:MULTISPECIES: type VII secretion-associated serine protease mycosin [unclassified Actinopolyspora]